MAVSPAIWFAESGDYWLEENQLIDFINRINVSKDVAFYIDIGTKEWEGAPVNAVDQTGGEFFLKLENSLQECVMDDLLHASWS